VQAADRWRVCARRRAIRCWSGPDSVTIGSGFSTALALTRASDLIATVPERRTGHLRDGMHSFPLPFSTAEITVSLLWHPRLGADPAHRWLRECVREVCQAIHRVIGSRMNC
jgi:DNA-binding transcriptional LysR family regulator